MGSGRLPVMFLLPKIHACDRGRTMLSAGLTGGIASGKSTVAQMLQEKGAHIIDFDTLAHSVQAPESAAWREIVELFGREVLNSDGTIDRAKLGAVVFGDKVKLARLNSIVHPAVFREARRRIALIQEEDPGAIVLSDIPLLLEVRAWEFMDIDVIVLVYVSPDEQVQRLIKRNGCSREEAIARLSSQMPIDEKVCHADVVIDNRGSFEKTKEIVEEVWIDLLERERLKRRLEAR